jgi:hypothetical protein
MGFGPVENGESMLRRHDRLQDDVTALLAHAAVIPAAA